MILLLYQENRVLVIDYCITMQGSFIKSRDFMSQKFSRTLPALLLLQVAWTGSFGGVQQAAALI